MRLIIYYTNGIHVVWVRTILIISYKVAMISDFTRVCCEVHYGKHDFSMPIAIKS